MCVGVCECVRVYVCACVGECEQLSIYECVGVPHTHTHRMSLSSVGRKWDKVGQVGPGEGRRGKTDKARESCCGKVINCGGNRSVIPSAWEYGNVCSKVIYIIY